MQSTQERSSTDADRTEADEKKSLEEKLWSSPLFWICMVLELSLIGAAIAVGTYFILVDGAKTNETDGSESGPDTDDAVPVEKICRPTTSNYKWEKDVDLLYESADGESYKLSIYSGAATYDEMQRVCSRLVRRPELPIRDGTYSYFTPKPSYNPLPIALFCPKLSQYQWIADIRSVISFPDYDLETWKVTRFNGTSKYEEMQQLCDAVDGKPAPESYIYTPSTKHTIQISLLCGDVSQHKWIADVNKIKTSPDGMNWNEETFQGAGWYRTMEKVCAEILRYPHLSFGKNSVRPTSQKEEEQIDRIVRKNKKLIFSNMTEDAKGLLWTGYYFEKTNGQWTDSFDSSESYKLFCYPNNFQEDIETFKKSNTFIIVAKDFRGIDEDHACWQLLPRISKVDDVEKDAEIYPVRLPFVCKSRLSDSSGAIGLPGSSWDVLKVKSTVNPGWEYLLSPFSATYSEALKECESLGAKLVIRTPQKQDELKKVIGDTTEFRSWQWAESVSRSGHLIWTGRYIDLLSDVRNYDGIGPKEVEILEELSKKAKSKRAFERCDDSPRFVHFVFKQYAYPGHENYNFVYVFRDDYVFKPDTLEAHVICERKIPN